MAARPNDLSSRLRSLTKNYGGGQFILVGQMQCRTLTIFPIMLIVQGIRRLSAVLAAGHSRLGLVDFNGQSSCSPEIGCSGSTLITNRIENAGVDDR